MESIDDDWACCADEEEQVEGPIVAKWTEDAPGSNKAPDDRCVKEDLIVGARPRTA